MEIRTMRFFAWFAVNVLAMLARAGLQIFNKALQSLVLEAGNPEVISCNESLFLIYGEAVWDISIRGCRNPWNF